MIIYYKHKSRAWDPIFRYNSETRIWENFTDYANYWKWVQHAPPTTAGMRLFLRKITTQEAFEEML